MARCGSEIEDSEWELHTIESLGSCNIYGTCTVHVPAFLSPEFWLGHLGTRRSFLKVACVRLSRWYVVFGLEALDKQVTFELEPLSTLTMSDLG